MSFCVSTTCIMSLCCNEEPLIFHPISISKVYWQQQNMYILQLILFVWLLRSVPYAILCANYDASNDNEDVDEIFLKQLRMGWTDMERVDHQNILASDTSYQRVTHRHIIDPSSIASSEPEKMQHIASISKQANFIYHKLITFQKSCRT